MSNRRLEETRRENMRVADRTWDSLDRLFHDTCIAGRPLGLRWLQFVELWNISY